MPIDFPSTDSASQKRRSKSAQSAKLLIEGESITLSEIAARYGVGARVMRDRLKREVGLDGPVLFANLLLTDAQRKKGMSSV